MSQLLHEELAHFRGTEAERIEGLLVINGRLDVQRVAVAWKNSRTKWDKPRSKIPTDKDDLWDWLWTGVTYSKRDLARTAMCATSRLNLLLTPLITNKLIYPDGTIATTTAQLLRNEIRKTLGGGKRRRETKDPETDADS